MQVSQNLIILKIIKLHATVKLVNTKRVIFMEVESKK